MTWWTSSVDHFRKEFFDVDGAAMNVGEGLEIRFLNGRLYKRNLSLARLVNHWQIGREFRVQCRKQDRPDAILCSFPTIELSSEAVEFAREHSIPIVLDIRDLWPDIFLQAAPSALRGLARLMLWPYFSSTRRALARADALIGVSKGYLDWGVAGAHRDAHAFDRVFPLAYSLPETTQETRATGHELLRRFGIDDGKVVCLFAGTLGRTYDLQPVLDCARQLSADSRQPFHFLICGDGERAPAWRAAATGLPNVSFTGWLAQDALRAALATAHVGLAAYAPNAPQGLPNKVIEYLAAGLPVVSSLRGETAELLAEAGCGTTYEAGDKAAFARALLALETSQAREPMARNARAVFEARFCAESIYAQLGDHLESLAMQARPGNAGILRGDHTRLCDDSPIG